MIILASTLDKLQLVTGAAVTVSVHASFMDYDSTTVTPGRKNTLITLGTTTDVAGSPGASVFRNIKTLHIRNTHATLPVDVTVQHTDGTVAVDLYKATLNAGVSIQYTNDLGFMQL